MHSRSCLARDHHFVSVEDVIAVEDDVFPRDGTDIAEQIEIDVFRQGVGLDDAMNFLGLPVDDAGDDEGEVATRMFLTEPVPVAQLPPVAASFSPA